MSTDDKHSDHDLKAYLEGRDGVSAAYRKAARDEPPAALDQRILDAARRHGRPATAALYATRKPYALAASVMIAIAGLSLYLGTLEERVVSDEGLQPAQVEAVEVRRLERAEAVQREPGDEERRAASEQQAAFTNRQLAPQAQPVGAADAPAAPPPAAAPEKTEALARSTEPPVIVIDGPLLESIEADAAAAGARQQRLVASDLQEIQVTGSRIMRREEGDVAYRETREGWLDEIRVMAGELESRSRLITARRSAAVLEEQLEEEIDLFLKVYPDTDIDAELEER